MEKMLEISRNQLAHSYKFDPGELSLGRYKIGELIMAIESLRGYYSDYYRKNREKYRVYQREYRKRKREKAL